VDVAVVRPGGTQPERAYVVEHGTGRVRIIDVATHTLSPEPIDLNPGGPALAPVAIAARSDGRRLFTADSTHRTISVIDINPSSPTPNTKLKELHTGSDASRLVLLRLPPPQP
jgi:DNA-binding beta-propeller fold protein YncE